MKRKLIVLLLPLAICVLPRIQAQSLGAGASIDARGYLKIDAPLYVIDRNPKKPGLKPAPASMNRPVYAATYEGEALILLGVTGGIVKGRLSVSLKKPADIPLFPLYEAEDFWNVPAHFFTDGTAAQIGEIFVEAYEPGEDGEGPNWVTLMNNPQVQFSLETDEDPYWIEGNVCRCIYALGDVSISGRVDLPQRGRTWRREFDIRLKQGWNFVLETDVLDKLTGIEYTKISNLPPASALWVMRGE